MKATLIGLLIQALLSVFTPDLVKRFIDAMFDFIETYVEGSASTVDDKIVLPIMEMLRKAMDIPDDD